MIKHVNEDRKSKSKIRTNIYATFRQITKYWWTVGTPYEKNTQI
jgi:hypothetical protein